MTTVQGIDVSTWQGAFDWQTWQNQIGFGLAKAAEGDAETDPDFGHNWDSMWWMNASHTFPRFAYLYFHASLDPVAQAAHLVSTVKDHGLLPGDHFVLDIESTNTDGQLNDGLTPAQCAPRAVECLQHINALAPNHRVLPYMSRGWGVSAPSVPQPWTRWTFWQYTDQPVDRDQYNGTQAELLSFCRMPNRR
jgi:lysozyme